VSFPAPRLETLSRPECLRLLATACVGRIVYTDHALPAVTPVNYAFDGTAVVFRTSAGSRLAAGTRDAVVALEVDALDERLRTGWSVVVVGLAEEIRAAGALLRAEQLRLASWVDGDLDVFVRLVPAEVSGRRLTAPSLGSRSRVAG
jgi:uncharacterized protein